MTNLSNILSQFNINGKIDKIEPLTAGLINDSYKVVTEGPEFSDYLLQRINNEVFKDISLLENNIRAVTGHIKNKLQKNNVVDINRRVLQFIETVNGGFVLNQNGNYWRLMIFIPDAVTLSEVNPKSSYYAGKAFGEFQYMLSDMDEELGETIPDFHNMQFRLKQLADAMSADSAGRLENVRYITETIESLSLEMTFAERLYNQEELPKRICHCDTKVNNMMYDLDGKPLCVIDLDTVMPAFIFSDYGDFLRSAANTAAEDEADLSLVGFDIDIFKAFTKGYLESSRSFLTGTEIENLPKAIALFPYMQAVRFLTDYLNGDVYFKTSYADHNLVRTLNQLRLLECIKEKFPEIQTYINTCQ